MAKSRTKTPSQRAAQARRRGARPGAGQISGQIRRTPPRSRWANRADRRRRILRIGAAVVVVAAVAAGLVWWRGRYREPAAPQAIPAGYHITYQVADLVGSGTTSRREVSVRRPFEIRDETFGADGSEQTGTIVNPQHSYVLTNGKLADLGTPAPSTSLNDFQLALVLSDLRRRGLAVPAGSATIAGRTCRIYRTGGPLGSNYSKPTAAEHADLCVDRDGYVLQEDWTTSGKETRKTTATAVDTTVPPDSTFQLAAGQTSVPLPATAAGAVVVPLPVDKPPADTASYWLADQPPWRFKLTDRARTASIQSVGGAATAGPGALIDAYTNGPRAILVSLQAANSTPSDSVAKRTVHVPGLGKGTASVAVGGPQVVFESNGTEVVVKGNVDIDHLVAFARHLRLHKAS